MSTPANPERAPRIHIVDDDAGMRDSLRLLFVSLGYEVASWERPEAFLESVQATDRGCLITDLRMPSFNGIELIDAIRDRGIRMPVVVVSAHGSIRHAVSALRRGAVDFVEKPFDDQDIIDAVHMALRNASAEDAPASTELAEIAGSLTRREREILALVVAGRPNKLIARELELSPRTVEAHRANLMHKLCVSSVAELVALAVRCRFVDTGEPGSYRSETG